MNKIIIIIICMFLLTTCVKSVTNNVNDVGVTSINNPSEEISPDFYTINATIDNFGAVIHDNVSIHCDIVRDVVKPFFSEDFSGNFPPNGWYEYGGWEQCDSSCSEGKSPEIYLKKSNIIDYVAYLLSKPIDTTDASILSLTFRHYLDSGSPLIWDYDCKIKIRANSIDEWTDITPWHNPILCDIGPEIIFIDISSYIGSKTQILFEYREYCPSCPPVISAWYLDDVKIQKFLYQSTVYQSDKIVDISSFTTDVEFTPLWDARSGYYWVTVLTNLSGDENPQNDKLVKRIIASSNKWDVNGDGKVDPFDSNIVMGVLGCDVSGDCEMCFKSDVNYDGVVNLFDSNEVMSHFN